MATNRTVTFKIEANDNISRTLGNIGKSFSDLGRQMDGVGGSTGKLGGALPKLGTAIAAVGGAALVTATGGLAALAAGIAGVVGIAGAGVKSAADLDQQVANIAATMGVAKSEAGALKQEIMDLSLDPNLKVDATEAALAVEMLARNGLDMEDILGGAAKSTVALSNATGADFSVAADVATDALANFNLSVSDMGKAVDGATGVLTNSKFDINDYQVALGQAGGVAGAFGVSLEDLNTGLAGTASLFSGGSDAGTSWKTFLMRLVPQSNEAIDAMRDLGLFTGLSGKEFEKAEAKIAKIDQQIGKLDPTSKNYTQRLAELTSQQNALKQSLVTGQNAFFDSEGNMKDMAEVSEVLRQATAGLSEEQKNMHLTTIFGSDAIRTAVGLADMGADEFSKLNAEVNRTGQASEAAATRMDTLKGAFEIFQGIIQGNLILIGDQFLPVIRRIVEAFTGLSEQAGPLVVSFFGALAGQLEDAVSMFEEAIPSVVEFLGSLSPKDVASQVLGFFGDLVSNIKAVGGMFLAAIPPVISFISNLTSGGSSGGVQSFLKGIGTTITETVLPAITGFANWWTTNWPLISAAVQTAWVIIQGVYNGIAEVITTQVVPQLQMAFMTITGGLDQLGLNWSDVWNALVTATGVVMVAIGALLGGLVAAVVGIVTAIAAALQTLANHWNDLMFALSMVIEGIQSIFVGLITFWQGIITGDWTKAWDGFVMVVSGAFQTLVGLVGALVTLITAPLAIILSAIKAFVSGVTGFFQGLYDTLVGHSIVPNMMQDISNEFSNSTGGIASTVQNWANNISQMFDGILSKKNDTMRNVGELQKAGYDVTFIPGVPIRAGGSHQGRQHGGPVSGGNPYLVGEAGPELFTPNQNGRIIPNQQTTNNYNLSVSSAIPSAGIAQDFQTMQVLAG